MADQRFPRTVKGAYYATRQAYQNSLAQAKGFPSYAVYRAAPKAIKSSRRRTSRERSSERKALAAKQLARLERISITRAAKRKGTTVSTVKRYESRSLRTVGRRLVPTLFDRLARPIRALLPNGVVTLNVRDSRTRSALGGYWDAVDHYLRMGDTSRLEPYRWRSFTTDKRGYRFITDTGLLDRLGMAGEFSFDDIYANGWID
jgi:hypothetical protein